MWGFHKIRGTILRAPIIRSIVFWVLYWGLPVLGKYHVIITPIMENQMEKKTEN